MPTAKVPAGPEMFYEAAGEGPPLLLISGTGHDHTFWSGQLPLFRNAYRAIVFDNRGVGRSGVPAPGYALADMADDAARVLDAAGTERAHVMGFSMGGHIAQELCLRHPGRVLSLGLHHTWARNCPRLESFQRTRKHLAERGEREALVELSLLGLYSHGYYDAHAEEMERRRAWLLGQSPAGAGWVASSRLASGGTPWTVWGGSASPPWSPPRTATSSWTPTTPGRSKSASPARS